MDDVVHVPYSSGAIVFRVESLGGLNKIASSEHLEAALNLEGGDLSTLLWDLRSQLTAAITRASIPSGLFPALGSSDARVLLDAGCQVVSQKRFKDWIQLEKATSLLEVFQD